MSKRCRDEDDRSMSSKLSVAIIGGGLGGLSCALALQKKGIECTVYEKDENFGARKQGYGLTLTNNEKGPLAELGILHKCVAGDCPSNWHWVFDRAGKVLGYYGREFNQVLSHAKDYSHDGTITSTGSGGSGGTAVVESRGNLRIPRQDLRQMLLDELRDGTVQWGQAIKDYIETEDCVKVEFVGGHSIDADVVVGADGIRSVIRQLRDAKLFGAHPSKLKLSPPLTYIGVSVILGLSTLHHPLLDQGGFYMYDGEHRLFTMPFRVNEKQTMTMWQLSFVGLTEDDACAMRSQDPEYLRSEALRRTQNCFEPVQDLVRETPAEEIWATGLYDRDPMQMRSKEKGTRVTVIGDAAHPMSMFKGQGANQAISDGPRLAKWLMKSTQKNGSKEIHTKIRCFEREMLQAAVPKVLASRAAA